MDWGEQKGGGGIQICHDSTQYSRDYVVSLATCTPPFTPIGGCGVQDKVQCHVHILYSTCALRHISYVRVRQMAVFTNMNRR